MTLPPDKAGSSSPERGAPISTIGAPPQRRSSRLSALLTTITWVSQTWLASRVPVLIIIGPSQESLLGLLVYGCNAQFVDYLAAKHLAGRVGGQFVAKDYSVRGSRTPQSAADVFAQLLGVGVDAGQRHH